MNTTDFNTNPSQSDTTRAELMIVSPPPVEPPSAWMQYGTSPTEIILATACVIVAVATVIGAIAGLINVLVPVMRLASQQRESTDEENCHS
ncbi:hypothetical protein [Halomicronema sp. CCY15110]|uniref:hypothetical protein n=1 Tax=Halomicronema sp. CCY15110 TaxID=2767773 RepID=UPI00194DC7AB|nr:hypothetical protein [Halomicronema sp. CCY15110]